MIDDDALFGRPCLGSDGPAIGIVVAGVAVSGVAVIDVVMMDIALTGVAAIGIAARDGARVVVERRQSLRRCHA